MGKTLEFERRETICVNIDYLANLLEDVIGDLLRDYQGLSNEDLECIDYDVIKMEISKIWLAECLEKGLTS